MLLKWTPDGLRKKRKWFKWVIWKPSDEKFGAEGRRPHEHSSELYTEWLVGCTRQLADFFGVPESSLKHKLAASGLDSLDCPMVALRSDAHEKVIWLMKGVRGGIPDRVPRLTGPDFGAHLTIQVRAKPKEAHPPTRESYMYIYKRLDW